MRWIRWVMVAVAVGVGAPGRVAQAEDPPTSLVDWLVAHHQDASFEARRGLHATHFPGVRYTGSAEQNVALLDRLLHGASAPPPVGAPGAGIHVREWAVDHPDGHWRARLDPSGQVLSVDAPPRTVWQRIPVAWPPSADPSIPPAPRQPPPPEVVEAEIFPTLSIPEKAFLSAAVLLQKAKQFDDGLYAAVELAAEEGAGTMPSKKAWLAALRERLGSASKDAVGAATAVPFAAARVGGATVETPATLEPAARSLIEAFEGETVRSKPLGFYTWSDALRAIFRQDRMLQTELAPGRDREALVEALRADPTTRAAYLRYLSLVERLTNPFTRDDLRPALAAADAGGSPPARPASLVPPCRSGETDLIHRLEVARIDPRGVNVLDAYVEGIRGGTISLALRPASGWYDRQQWAFEPFLLPERMPEAARLRLSAPYKARLEELFRGALALARETHVKNLDCFSCGACRPPPTVRVFPDMTVEPLPTAYLRRAEGYAFVRSLLVDAFGRDALGCLRRQTAAGPVATPLGDELDRMEAIFTGAYARSCREIGHPTAPRAGLDEAEAALDAWRSSLESDPDVGLDARMMVPVLYDGETGRTKVWVFLGWTQQDLVFDWVTKPKVTVTRAPTGAPIAKDEVCVQFGASSAVAWYPVVAEAWTTHILDRTEFRGLCDAKKTKTAILEALLR